MNDMVYVIAGMAVVTQCIRLAPGMLRWKPSRNLRVTRFLRAIPLAALGALIAPGVLEVGGAAPIGFSGAMFSLVLALMKVHLVVNILLSILFVSILMHL